MPNQIFNIPLRKKEIQQVKKTLTNLKNPLYHIKLDLDLITDGQYK
jgi:hypothetical protein